MGANSWFWFSFNVGDVELYLDVKYPKTVKPPTETLLAIGDLSKAVIAFNRKLDEEKGNYQGIKILIPEDRINELIAELSAAYEQCECTMNLHGYQRNGSQPFVQSWCRTGSEGTFFWACGGCIFDVPEPTK
jgi:hypothetical protein